MSLQRRLTLVFVFIVFLPLAVAGYVVQRVVTAEFSNRLDMSLVPPIDTTVTLYNERVTTVGETVRAAIATPRFARLLERGQEDTISGFLHRRLEAVEGLDFLVVVDPRDRVVAWSQRSPDFVPGMEPVTADDIVASGRTGEGFHRTAPIPVRVSGGGVLGHVIGGFWLDEVFLKNVATSGVDVALAVGGRIVASTGALERAEPISIRRADSFEVDLGEPAMARARELSGGVYVVTTTPLEPMSDLSRRVMTSFVLLLAVALIVTAVLAAFLARQITQPLDALARGTRAIAQGDLSHRIPVWSRDEVGEVAVAFNEMTEQLETTINELSSSRDRMQRTVRRVGDVLRSAHDLRAIFNSALSTATEAVQADAAILWTVLPQRDEMGPAAVLGIDERSLGRVALGEGLAGFALQSGRPVVSDARVGGPASSSGEPDFPVAMAVPLFSERRIGGVIVLYRADGEVPFTGSDIETVRFLAEQTGVAMENVALHEEAQRLSLTDGLTHTYNRRYFQVQFRQALATAARFHRPFSVLMCDLDHFKDVNDTYGHQRGDAILIEFVQRATAVLREIDTFARYGGEEFICLLAETERDGAVVTAEKIRDAVRAKPFGTKGEELIALTVSIGVATHPHHGDSYNSLVEAADQALYAAKQAGRNRVCVAGEGSAPLKVAT